MTSNIVCIDASFIVRYLSQNDENSIYYQKWQKLQQNNYSLIAPTLIMYEIAKVVNFFLSQ